MTTLKTKPSRKRRATAMRSGFHSSFSEIGRKPRSMRKPLARHGSRSTGRTWSKSISAKAD